MRCLTLFYLGKNKHRICHKSICLTKCIKFTLSTAIANLRKPWQLNRRLVSRAPCHRGHGGRWQPGSFWRVLTPRVSPFAGFGWVWMILDFGCFSFDWHLQKIRQAARNVSSKLSHVAKWSTSECKLHVFKKHAADSWTILQVHRLSVYLLKLSTGLPSFQLPRHQRCSCAGCRGSGCSHWCWAERVSVHKRSWMASWKMLRVSVNM